jgi:pimeloyl-ACP methyl ester carboxylesterase
LNRDSKIKYFAGELRNQAAYLDSDVTANLGSIGVPTLVVHGNLDTQVPYDLGKELSVHIKNARFVTIPKAGHGVMQWPKSVSAIQEFCDEIMSLKKG